MRLPWSCVPPGRQAAGRADARAFKVGFVRRLQPWLYGMLGVGMRMFRPPADDWGHAARVPHGILGPGREGRDTTASPARWTHGVFGRAGRPAFPGPRMPGSAGYREDPRR